MDVIEIGNSKLIVILDSDDMNKYAFDVNEHSADLRECFSKIITDCGLDDQFSSGVLVQIFDSINGGCEMFVTKLPDTLEGDDTETKKSYIYIFNNIEDLLSACKMVCERQLSDGKLCFNKKKQLYYLILNCEYINLCEFNGQFCKDDTIEYINEHCITINDISISKLASLA